MDYDAWSKEFKRMCALYGKTVNGQQGAEYFKALDGFTLGIVEQAITRVAREHKTWPSAAVLVEAAKGVVRGLSAPGDACDRCHGETWVDAPDRVINDNRYRYVDRCPQCWRPRPEVA